jgi:hypothetical protein
MKMKKKQWLLILLLSSVQIFANSEIPDNELYSGPEAPIASPIDIYIVLSMFICFVLVGYYFYKYDKTYLNNEK